MLLQQLKPNIMKKLISTILFLLFVLIIKSCATRKECHCATFKNGKYLIGEETPSTDYYIVRNDSIQKEIDVKKGEINLFNIIWISDCKYILTMKEGNQQLMNFYKGKQLVITLIETYPDGYKYSAEMNGMKTIYGVMKKMN
jgi:hypothetical protein